MKRHDGIIAIGIILAVLIFDQAVKIAIKTHFMLGEEVAVCGDWFKLHFVENNGMAFGMEIGSGEWGKIALSVFRIVAVIAIGYFIYTLCNRKEKPVSIMTLVCVSLVWAGAFGNIIDSLCYGVIFDSSWGQVATLFPEGGGYSTWLHGRVVDMLYFPLIEGHFPDWLPIYGGEPFIFFHPVFNIADAAISVGIALAIIFCNKELAVEFENMEKDKKANKENA